jgi:hypothetical protein
MYQIDKYKNQSDNRNANRHFTGKTSHSALPFGIVHERDLFFILSFLSFQKTRSSFLLISFGFLRNQTECNSRTDLTYSKKKKRLTQCLAEKKDSYQIKTVDRLENLMKERTKKSFSFMRLCFLSLSEIGNFFVFCDFGVCFQNESLTATWVIGK